MLKGIFALAIGAGIAVAQAPPSTPHGGVQGQGPPVRLNILNVCTPGATEQKEIAAALARIPQRPSFGPDYEITRGHTTGDSGSASDWVRIRREFPSAMPLLAVQFSFSEEPQHVRETTVFYSREAKDVMQVALEDEAPPGAGATAALAMDTPVSHIRIERYGKPSLVLARCPNADQTAYEPLFRSASQIMSAYRARLDAKQIVPAELRRGVPSDGRRPARVKPMGRRGAPESKP